MLHQRGFLAEKIYNRLRRNKNCLLVFTGETGSGKSFSGLDLALDVDPTFNIERIIFDPIEFVKKINSGEVEKGQALLFDEAGVIHDARTWYSDTNRAMNHCVQTFRKLNLFTIFTVPNINFIDKQARYLMHILCDCFHIDYNNKTVCAKVYRYVMRAKYKEPHTHFFTHRNPRTGKLQNIEAMLFRYPNKKLAKKYEAKKDEFIKVLYEKRIREAEHKQQKEKDKLEIKESNAECKKCGYEWYTKSRAIHPSCPVCQSRNTSTSKTPLLAN